MSALKNALQNHFGEHRVVDVPGQEGDFPLLAINIESKGQQVTLIMTNGLSEKTMIVPEKVKERKHIELFFALPSYWEWDELENPKRNWIFTWIQKLAKHLMSSEEIWFGYGHTFSNKIKTDDVSDFQPLSPTMKQQHLILLDPIELEYELQKMKIDDKEVYFQAIVPIYSDELDYKQGNSARKLVRKMMNSGVSEILDDFRGTVLRAKWRLF